MARYILIAEVAKRLIAQGFGSDEAWRRARLLDDTTREACRSPYVAGEETREPPFNPNARER